MMFATEFEAMRKHRRRLTALLVLLLVVGPGVVVLGVMEEWLGLVSVAVLFGVLYAMAREEGRKFRFWRNEERRVRSWAQ